MTISSAEDIAGAKLALSNLLSVFSNHQIASRRAAIEATFHPSITFSEPDGRVTTGFDALSKRVDELLAMGTEWIFKAAGPVKKAGTGVYVLEWVFGPRGAETDEVEVRMKGLDINFVEDGKIAKFWVVIDGLGDVNMD